MIFVTTGTQAPFNRLVLAMDQIAEQIAGEKIIVQASGIDFEVKNMEVVDFMAPEQYNQIFNEARLIISHAGMGTIISALKSQKRIIIVPRVAALGEHRNEHQLATAKKIEELNYMPVVYDVELLKEKVLQLLHDNSSRDSVPDLGDLASDSLINSLHDFILTDRK